MNHDDTHAVAVIDKGNGSVLIVGNDDQEVAIYGTPDELLTFARRVHNEIADRIAAGEG